MKTVLSAGNFTIALLLIAGCNSSAHHSGSVVSHEAQEHDHSHHLQMEHGHSHEHAEIGPRGGHLIELGRKHEYHAELTENAGAESVSVFILDKNLHDIAINEEAVTLNIVAGAEVHMFQLMAVQSVSTTGITEYIGNDPRLFHLLREEDVTGKLRVRIKGVPYVGDIEHEAHGNSL